jgi:hypothetical protein
MGLPRPPGSPIGSPSLQSPPGCTVWRRSCARALRRQCSPSSSAGPPTRAEWGAGLAAVAVGVSKRCASPQARAASVGSAWRPTWPARDRQLVYASRVQVGTEGFEPTISCSQSSSQFAPCAPGKTLLTVERKPSSKGVSYVYQRTAAQARAYALALHCIPPDLVVQHDTVHTQLDDISPKAFTPRIVTSSPT